MFYCNKFNTRVVTQFAKKNIPYCRIQYSTFSTKAESNDSPNDPPNPNPWIFVCLTMSVIMVGSFLNNSFREIRDKVERIHNMVYDMNYKVGLVHDKVDSMSNKVDIMNYKVDIMNDKVYKIDDKLE